VALGAQGKKKNQRGRWLKRARGTAVLGVTGFGRGGISGKAEEGHKKSLSKEPNRE